MGNGGNAHQRAVQAAREREMSKEPTEAGLAPISNGADQRFTPGDSIGLLALILAAVGMVATLPFLAKASLLLGSGVLWYWFVRKSHWTYSWPRAFQVLAALAGIGIIAVIGVPQLIAQWREEHTYFSVLIDTSISGTNRNSAPFMAQYSREKRCVLYPVNVALHMRITNNMPKATLIDGYRVEAKNGDGKWVPLIRLKGVFVRLYTPIVGTPNGKQFYTPLLDRELQQKNLVQGDSVSGLALFAFPDGSTYDGREYRVTITDTPGKQSTTYSVASPKYDTSIDNVQEWNIRNLSNDDLSKCEVEQPH